MAVHSNVFRLEQLQSHQGLSPSDLLAEFQIVTLSAGTAECPTIFSDGDIVAVFLAHVNNATVNSAHTLSTDRVVTNGAITIVGPTGSTAVVAVLIIGRTKV